MSHATAEAMMSYVNVRNGLEIKSVLIRGTLSAKHTVMYTHNVIDDVLHMGVGVVPEVRVLRHADVADAECNDNCVGGV